MLLSHGILVAVFSICSLKVINDSLLDRHLVLTLTLSERRRTGLGLSGNFEIDFGAYGPVVLVEALFTAQWMTWIEDVVRLTIDLVAADHDSI